MNHVPWNTRELLAFHATSSFRQAISELYINRTRGAIEEPDIIASLIFEGLPLCARTWSHTLPALGLRFQTSGVFCHQSPKVKFIPNPQRLHGCELGDLLFAHFHTDSTDHVSRRALLLQAKVVKYSKSAYSPTGGASQLTLYLKWPAFAYANGSFKGELREVAPHSRHVGAKYLLIRAPDPARLPERTELLPCSAGKVLTPSRSLGDELARLVLLDAGRRFSSYQQSRASRGWSRVVWDLLLNAKDLANAFNRRNAGYVGNIRLETPESIAELDGAPSGPDWLDTFQALPEDGLPERTPQEVFDTERPVGASVVVSITRSTELQS
jgi:hypothetical protein